MNSEELEQSLRTEFEEHLKQVFADVRQEMSALQGQIEQEFERHRSQLSEAFESFAARADSSDRELDAAFRESIVEHLRLSRDEGARITATAIAEAEAMEKAAAEVEAAEAEAIVPLAGIGELRDGINDICAQNSQAAILKSLVAHAGQFTPRGAFFIVKNEHLVGWRVFGRDENPDEDSSAVREIFFSVSDKTSLGESLKSLNAVESAAGEYAGDAAFLDKLEFGEPERMVSIPLVARGRGVAVLYADKGADNGEINVEALETLVRVAGLTVEVLAATAGAAAPSARQTPAANFAQPEAQIEEPQPSEENYRAEDEPESNEAETAYGYDESAETVGEPSYQTESAGDDYSAASDYQTETAQPDAASNDYSTARNSVEEESIEPAFEAPSFQAEEFQPSYQEEKTDGYSWNQPVENEVEESAKSESESVETESHSYGVDDAARNQYQFEDDKSYQLSENEVEQAPAAELFQDLESAQFDAQASFETAPDYAPAAAANEVSYGAFEPQNNDAAADDNFDATPVDSYAEVKETPKPARSRFSDRNIDLPVEVGEDERRLHNDARRFARLLVSEIKLYNEQKVKEGRDENDLYERLREAIDRSREMYDKRVQPQVAGKFDYFHYELVNSLADGDEAKLGDAYVGAAV